MTHEERARFWYVLGDVCAAILILSAIVVMALVVLR